MKYLFKYLFGSVFSGIYSETLPLEAPPSFRGTAVKYSYKLTIGTQRFSCATKLLRVPFRVFVLPGKYWFNDGSNTTLATTCAIFVAEDKYVERSRTPDSKSREPGFKSTVSKLGPFHSLHSALVYSAV